MANSILVAYATRYGSTQEVAERVAATLRDGGLEVDLQPAGQVESLEGVDAVVLGSPLYIGRWLGDAQRFLARHQQALTARRVAVFTLGPVRAGEGEWDDVRGQLEAQLAKYPWLSPVATELFGGVYDPGRLSFLHRLLAAVPASPLHGIPATDLRDWAAIEAWAGGLVATLGASAGDADQT